ncbi:hypothetical protein G6F70_002051 [Rhizopus microsporus]|uniref:PHP domain-like protein n=1 Tax=Rhizopus microsporus TaxID=58291 RepID=A0A1X0S821_RHIZD|nr:hypothetical protein G6F71_002160 [Rhizopus microsporus]KAG1202668.1 hypothetical protein G6F70_002051 [Rhizopus microsporus]KAG1215734.1 hypothetical protein G6F69_000721 [Rhizopus microsporus]KAG1236838.1 hypothetical protein G6F67_001659 [Rhizopus microsporus]KAG1268603.1 hypothetical protein G6F68_000968 [Rhizopus microsporus]
MYYDFNIPYPSNPTKEDLNRIEKILERIHSDQSSIIALNVSSKSGVSEVKPVLPIAPDRFPNMKQLTRATIEIDDHKKNYQLSSSSSSTHVDILAVRPSTIDVCKHACQNLEIDVISLDLANTKTAPNFAAAQVAVSRGIFFEICYAQSFKNPGKKATFFSNVKRLVDVTRGHNLFFSSEALRALEIRKPADLRILGALFGMTQDQIEASVNLNYAKLLKKAETRKSTYNAAIRNQEVSQTEKRKQENQGQQNKSNKKAKKAQ